MSNILRKEIKLSAHILSFLFIGFGVMFLLPGYPVLCGAFFICLGIFQSFQNTREANDILFSILLPISKKDIVKGKFLFVCFIEMCGITVMFIATLLRMTLLSDSKVYLKNALMNANLFALGMAFLIFGCFNLIFVRGFFKTAYKFGKPFISFIVANFLLIALAESMHYFPHMKSLNAFGFEHLGLQICLLFSGILLYLLLTFIAMKQSFVDFEKIDL
ncbi:ABC-2 family transporter protein [Lachnospiraceae bacterium RM5]|nr:ABC-2 family transporter protein [Lachnospiraceae bacterium RM5]